MRRSRLIDDLAREHIQPLGMRNRQWPQKQSIHQPERSHAAPHRQPQRQNRRRRRHLALHQLTPSKTHIRCQRLHEGKSPFLAMHDPHLLHSAQLDPRQPPCLVRRCALGPHLVFQEQQVRGQLALHLRIGTLAVKHCPYLPHQPPYALHTWNSSHHLSLLDNQVNRRPNTLGSSLECQVDRGRR